MGIKGKKKVKKTSKSPDKSPSMLKPNPGLTEADLGRRSALGMIGAGLAAASAPTLALEPLMPGASANEIELHRLELLAEKDRLEQRLKMLIRPTPEFRERRRHWTPARWQGQIDETRRNIATVNAFLQRLDAQQKPQAAGTRSSDITSDKTSRQINRRSDF
jgi:hypothetical protein